ncbi:MAG: OsmC family protein [Candidatus Methanoperedens sp.]|nr:OsmC family protein [Candidatus Methanoperedens sp.]
MLNGIDVDQLLATINAVKQNPDIARFQFRTDTEWVSGGHSRSSAQGFFGAGTEDSSRKKPFIIEGDEPPVLLGSNAGPNAVEAILASIGSCLAVGFVYNAAAQGIKVKSLRFTIKGDIDLHGFLGLSEEIRPGYQNISVNYKINSDAPREKIEELCEYVQRTSPVLDMIRNGLPVSVTLED